MQIILKIMKAAVIPSEKTNAGQKTDVILQTKYLRRHLYLPRNVATSDGQRFWR